MTTNGPFTDDGSQSTRHLSDLIHVPQSMTSSTPMTGPLDCSLPWVIEFRVVGTPSMVQVRLTGDMLVGRSDPGQGIKPEIDLTPYKGFAAGVSRRHAKIFLKNDRLFVQDLRSTNGTALNGITCQPDQEYRLRHGDELSFGRLRMQVRFAVIPATDRLRSTQEMRPLPVEIPNVGSGQHVLVIEDDAEVRNVFRLALENAGYNVTTVPDVAKALGVLFYKMPDVIVLDLMLPEMNGVDLVKYIRKHETDKHVPLIVVSGAAGGYQAQQALDAGVEAFLPKPIGVEELVKAVAQVVKS